jgi:hypothetical protein
MEGKPRYMIPRWEEALPKEQTRIMRQLKFVLPPEEYKEIRELPLSWLASVYEDNLAFGSRPAPIISLIEYFCDLSSDELNEFTEATTANWSNLTAQGLPGGDPTLTPWLYFSRHSEVPRHQLIEKLHVVAAEAGIVYYTERIFHTFVIIQDYPMSPSWTPKLWSTTQHVFKAWNSTLSRQIKIEDFVKPTVVANR